MAIARDTFFTRNTQNNNNWTRAYTITGANPALVIFVEMGGGSDTSTGATYNGVSMTKVSAVNVYSTVWIAMYILINPATGNNTISVTFSGVANHSITGASYTGVTAGGSTGGSDSSGSFTWVSVGGVNRSVTTTTVSSACWIVAFLRANSGSYTDGPNATVVDNPDLQDALADTNGPITPAGATVQTFTWVTGTTDGGILSVALQPAPVASTISVTVGAFILTGIDSIITRMKTLAAGIGAFILSGINVLFTNSGWTNQGGNSSSFNNQTKNSSTYTNQVKDSGSWTNQTRH